MYLTMWFHVRDYDDWKTAFDAGEALRTSHGCTGHEIFRSDDDPGQLTIFLSFPSREDGESFLADPMLKEKMAEAGVDGEPRTMFVTQTQRVDYRSRKAA
jgi:quinol monooxygenase YgiN